MKREELLAKKAAGTVLTAEEETFLASSESDSETPPTPTPAPSATNDGKDRYIGVLEETLREQNRQIQQLMTGATPPATPPAAPDPDKEKQDFYNDPAGTTRRIINDALAESIKPLQDFVKGLKIDGSPFSNMMGKFKADARFSDTLSDPQVVAAVERIMEKAELSEVNMQSAIVHASGLKAMGLLGTVVPASASPAPAPTPTPAPSTVLPPHVRPSAAPTPAPAPNGNSPVRPPMTENQRRIMREQGFKSEEEYWKWMDMSAAEVAESKLGQVPAGGR